MKLLGGQADVLGPTLGATGHVKEPEALRPCV